MNYPSCIATAQELLKKKYKCPRCSSCESWVQSESLTYCSKCRWWFEGMVPDLVTDKAIATVGENELALLFRGMNAIVGDVLLIPGDAMRLAAKNVEGELINAKPQRESLKAGATIED